MPRWLGPTKGIVRIEPVMAAEVKLSGRYKDGAIRDGVILSIANRVAEPGMAGWSCDSHAVVAAFDANHCWSSAWRYPGRAALSDTTGLAWLIRSSQPAALQDLCDPNTCARGTLVIVL